jgi:hypothetical protein
VKQFKIIKFKMTEVSFSGFQTQKEETFSLRQLTRSHKSWLAGICSSTGVKTLRWSQKLSGPGIQKARQSSSNNQAEKNSFSKDKYHC